MRARWLGCCNPTDCSARTYRRSNSLPSTFAQSSILWSARRQGFGKKACELVQRLFRRLLSKVMTGRQRPSPNIDGDRSPILERLETAMDDALVAPMHEQRTFHLDWCRNMRA